MDLKELACFRAVAELGTISKAAAHLRIAQPALSRQIRKLEHSLGVELLQRNSKGVMLTAAGSLLLSRTASLESELAEIQQEVSRLSAGVRGSLRLAVQMPLSTHLIPGLVQAYRAQHPGVSLRVLDGYSADVTDALLQQRLDLAIIDTPSHTHSDLSITPFWEDVLKSVGPSTGGCAMLSNVQSVPLSEVVKLPLILPSRRYAVRRLIDAAFSRGQLKAVPIVEADGPLMILAMVHRGLGYTLIPTFGASELLECNQLRAFETIPPIMRPISIVTHTAVLHERRVVTFLKLLNDSIDGISLENHLHPSNDLIITAFK